MKQYLDLLSHILIHGVRKSDRTGIGTISVFGKHMRFDLSKGFPLVTTKRVHLRSVIHELLWILRGKTNIKALNEVGVTIWNEWADEDGNLGPIYGHQWLAWRGANGQTYNQIEWIVNEIQRNPDSRRLIVSAWNVADLTKMRLVPCHCLFQFYVSNSRLSCQVYQRSADMFLGVPFNIASYALLTHMIAQVCGLQLGDLILTLGDAHIYLTHLEQVRTQISRETKPLPKLVLNPDRRNLYDFVYNDINIEDYSSHTTIEAPVAV